MSGHLWAQAKTWDRKACLVLCRRRRRCCSARSPDVLLTRRMDGGRTLLAAAGLLAVGLGVLLDRFFMPINKSLWTPSYAVFMSGYSATALAACYWFADGSGNERLRHHVRTLLLPFVMFGVNALAIFACPG